MTDKMPIDICVAALVFLASVTDLLSRRIPNWLTLSGICAGLGLNAMLGGLAGLRLSAAGMLLGFGAYFILYCLRAMGAGDVKLMAAVGAMVGPAGWFSVFIATAIAGGVLALALTVAKRRLRQTLWNAFFIVTELAQLRAPWKSRGDLDVRNRHSLKMPHAVAIAAGTVAFLAMTRG